jgi:DNA (cytosine-5)-methyltransferase 1
MACSQHKLKIAELFAGTGNFGDAFSSSGFEVVYANDIDKHCKVIYDKNHSVEMTLGDIRDVKDTIPVHDILLAGFPCQPFSIAGDKKGFDDKRGHLFDSIVFTLSKRKPLFFVLENVSNLQTHDNGKTFDIMMNALSFDLGYHTKVFIMSPHTHASIPQSRKRIFIVGFRYYKHWYDFNVPSPVSLETSFRDYLEDAVDEKFYIQPSSIIYERTKEIVTDPNKVYVARRKNEVREIKSGLVPTLMAKMGTGGNNVPIIFDKGRVRKLTPRECARFQGMSDDFNLSGVSLSQVYKQIGNAVCVPVISRIAQEIQKIYHFCS